MGNDLNAMQRKVREDIQYKISNTGNEKLDFPSNKLELTKLPANEARELLLKINPDLTLDQLFQLFHHAKQLNANEHVSMTDVFYFEPLIEAFKFQRIIEQGTKQDKDDLPLLGYVFSIKEYLAIKGTDATWGYFYRVGIPSTATAPFLEFLKTKGGLLSCKGNLPQSLMAIESSNEVFGYCCNPHNKARVSGGSSGGEGASIALGLVNCGIGSDIGGSIRIPALYCGIYGFKPTAGRYHYASAVGLFQGTPFEGKEKETQYIIAATLGPMANSAKDCTAITKVMNEFSLTCQELPPLQWIEPVTPKKIGFVPEFNSYLKLPDVCTRAFQEAKAALQANGFELVEVNLNHLIDEIAINTITCFFKDQALIDVFREQTPILERHIESYNDTVQLFNTPPFMLKFLHGLSITSSRDKMFIEATLRAKTTNSIVLKIQQNRLTRLVWDEFKKAGVDVALAYGLFPAPKLRQTEGVNYGIAYTFIWNYLNFPAGVVPVTRVRDNEQYFESEVGDKFDLIMEETMKDSKGLPVGIQVVGLPWKDELVLKTMELLEAHLEN